VEVESCIVLKYIYVITFFGHHNVLSPEIAKKRRKSFVAEAKKYLKHREDIDMGWVNVQWGISPNVSPQHLLRLDKTNVLN
jgi:hypothetical protein